MKRILRILVVVIIITFIVGILFYYHNSRNSFFDASDEKKDYTDSIVQITIDTHTGTGIVWKASADSIVILSNKHLLENEGDIVITLENGLEYEASLLSLSNEFDVGFCEIENNGSLNLKAIAKADGYETGEPVTHIGVNTKRGAGEDFLIFFDGEITDYKFIPEFYEMMLLSTGYSQKGMSGGAILNADNKLVGLLSGGEEINDSFVTYAVAISDIENSSN